MLSEKARFLVAGIAAAALTVPAIPAVRAEPPPWAPAHGYRAKQKHKHAQPIVVSLPRGLTDGRCSPSLLDSKTVGGLVGAAAGGLAGSQIGGGRGQLAATAIGALVGFVIGQEIGSALAQPDERCIAGTLEHVPDGQRIQWVNPDQRADYTLQPTRTYRTDGRYCREYTARATVGGRAETVYGTACRQPDGQWQLMS